MFVLRFPHGDQCSAPSPKQTNERETPTLKIARRFCSPWGPPRPPLRHKRGRAQRSRRHDRPCRKTLRRGGRRGRQVAAETGRTTVPLLKTTPPPRSNATSHRLPIHDGNRASRGCPEGRSCKSNEPGIVEEIAPVGKRTDCRADCLALAWPPPKQVSTLLSPGTPTAIELAPLNTTSPSAPRAL